ncbi:3'-5' exonuclease [Weeksella virosa]|uniref:3'-5' exonuclease n=1 Tax=Weeksella virosa TaxID=1014 RepID=UPI002554A14D|nr:3'-5' exonuclease [Weeksella virosa]MDK7374520.1 3'-5' exonuclease [Weeksella virosa]
MKKILFFDIETTGLPTSFSIKPSKTEHWPHIVEIAWIISDYDSDVALKEKRFIVKPEGYQIPVESSRIHKITHKKAELEGVSVNFVIEEFLNDLETCNVLVAHNIEFDKNVIAAELYRQNINPKILNKLLEFCTMKTFTEFCAIPQRGGYDYKWPTLNELHQKVFGVKMKKSHSALADVTSVKNCFYELRKSNYFELLTPEEQAEKEEKLKENEILKQAEAKRKEDNNIFKTFIFFFCLLLLIILIVFGMNLIIALIISVVLYVILENFYLKNNKK